MTEARTDPPGPPDLEPDHAARRARSGSATRPTFGPGGREPCAPVPRPGLRDRRGPLGRRSTGSAGPPRSATTPDRSGLAELLGRLAAAIRGDGLAGPVAVPFPPCRERPTFSIHRHGATLTTWEVVADQPGPAPAPPRGPPGRPGRGRPDRRATSARPSRASGRRGRATGTGHLLIRYDPAGDLRPGLIRLGRGDPARARAAAASDAPMRSRPGSAWRTSDPGHRGRRRVPGPGPAAGQRGPAGRHQPPDLPGGPAPGPERKRLGLPVLYIAIVATTLATGQFLASALMTWFFRFWHRRFRVELATERSRLLGRGSGAARRWPGC